MLIASARRGHREFTSVPLKAWGIGDGRSAAAPPSVEPRLVQTAVGGLRRFPIVQAFSAA
jgi:hypothetical protein